MVVDIGINLASKKFDKYRDELLEHCSLSYIDAIVSISNCRNEWDLNINLIQKYKNNKVKIYTTIGIHPHNAKEVKNESFYEEMTKYLALDNVVAVGECGLDYNRMFSPKEKQIEVFKRQIEIANIVKKPLYMHERDASVDMINILTETMNKYPDMKGVIHCFTGNKDTLKKYVELGFSIGITGWICDKKRNSSLVEAIKELPLDKMMIETDAPYLTPPKYYERFETHRNEPDSLEYVIESITEHTGYTAKNIIKHSRENAIKLFNLTISSQNK